MTKLGRAAVIATIGALTLAGCSRSPEQKGRGKAGPQCGPPQSWPGATFISIVNQTDGAQKSCRFFSHELLPLETQAGFNATWLFCNQCDLDVKVVLDTWDYADWADSFDFITPTQIDTRSIELVVPAHEPSRSLTAYRALATGRFQYKAHIIPAGYMTPSDTIDPQLQIKRTGGLVLGLITGVISMLIGLAVGFWLGRRRRAAAL